MYEIAFFMIVEFLDKFSKSLWVNWLCFSSRNPVKITNSDNWFLIPKVWLAIMFARPNFKS